MSVNFTCQLPARTSSSLKMRRRPRLFILIVLDRYVDPLKSFGCYSQHCCRSLLLTTSNEPTHQLIVFRTHAVNSRYWELDNSSRRDFNDYYPVVVDDFLLLFAFTRWLISYRNIYSRPLQLRFTLIDTYHYANRTRIKYGTLAASVWIELSKVLDKKHLSSVGHCRRRHRHIQSGLISNVNHLLHPDTTIVCIKKTRRRKNVCTNHVLLFTRSIHVLIYGCNAAHAKTDTIFLVVIGWTRTPLYPGPHYCEYMWLVAQKLNAHHNCKRLGMTMWKMRGKATRRQWYSGNS